VRADAGLRNHVHVQVVRARETLETDIILVGNVGVFLVALGPVLFHVMLMHLSLDGVSLTTIALATDWLSFLIKIWRGYSRGGVAVECDVVSLLEGVHETELASKWADIEAHLI